MSAGNSSNRRRGLVVLLLSVAVLVCLVVVVITSSGNNDAVIKPATTEPPAAGLQFKVVGHCVSGGGRLFGTGSGFTPNGKYVTEVWRPDGHPYIGIHNPGTATVTGTLETWRWPCYSDDPPGTYKVRITDLQSGKDTGIVDFQVGKPATGNDAGEQSPSGQMS